MARSPMMAAVKLGWANDSASSSSALPVSAFADHAVTFVCVRSPDGGYELAVEGLATFSISPDGSTVVARPLAPELKALTEEVYRHTVLPRIFQLQGAPSLHASAVLTPRGTVAFLGRTGSGKSTMAAALSKRWPLVSDDYVRVDSGGDRPSVDPASRHSRLREDAQLALGGTAERRIHGKVDVAFPSAQGPSELARMYVLHEGTAVAITRLRRRDALLELASQLHRLDATDRELLATEMSFLSELVERVPLSRLAYPRRFESFDDVARAIEADLEDDVHA